MKKIRIHPLFLIVVFLLILLGLWKELSLILFTLTIHELGHLFFINILDYDFYTLNLMAFGGVLSYKEKNDFLYKSLLISLGGIWFNLFFYILFYLLGFLSLSNINLLFVFIILFENFIYYVWKSERKDV